MERENTKEKEREKTKEKEENNQELDSSRTTEISEGQEKNPESGSRENEPISEYQHQETQVSGNRSSTPTMSPEENASGNDQIGTCEQQGIPSFESDNAVLEANAQWSDCCAGLPTDGDIYEGTLVCKCVSDISFQFHDESEEDCSLKLASETPSPVAISTSNTITTTTTTTLSYVASTVSTVSPVIVTAASSTDTTAITSTTSCSTPTTPSTTTTCNIALTSVPIITSTTLQATEITTPTLPREIDITTTTQTIATTSSSTIPTTATITVPSSTPTVTPAQANIKPSTSSITSPAIANITTSITTSNPIYTSPITVDTTSNPTTTTTLSDDVQTTSEDKLRRVQDWDSAELMEKDQKSNTAKDQKSTFTYNLDLYMKRRIRPVRNILRELLTVEKETKLNVSVKNLSPGRFSGDSGPSQEVPSTSGTNFTAENVPNENNAVQVLTNVTSIPNDPSVQNSKQRETCLASEMIESSIKTERNIVEVYSKVDKKKTEGVNLLDQVTAVTSHSSSAFEKSARNTISNVSQHDNVKSSDLKPPLTPTEFFPLDQTPYPHMFEDLHTFQIPSSEPSPDESQSNNPSSTSKPKTTSSLPLSSKREQSSNKSSSQSASSNKGKSSRKKPPCSRLASLNRSQSSNQKPSPRRVSSNRRTNSNRKSSSSSSRSSDRPSSSNRRVSSTYSISPSGSSVSLPSLPPNQIPNTPTPPPTSNPFPSSTITSFQDITVIKTTSSSITSTSLLTSAPSAHSHNIVRGPLTSSNWMPIPSTDDVEQSSSSIRSNPSSTNNPEMWNERNIFYDEHSSHYGYYQTPSFYVPSVPWPSYPNHGPVGSNRTYSYHPLSTTSNVPFTTPFTLPTGTSTIPQHYQHSQFQLSGPTNPLPTILYQQPPYQQRSHHLQNDEQYRAYIQHLSPYQQHLHAVLPGYVQNLLTIYLHSQGSSTLQTFQHSHVPHNFSQSQSGPSMDDGFALLPDVINEALFLSHSNQYPPDSGVQHASQDSLQCVQQAVTEDPKQGLTQRDERGMPKKLRKYKKRVTGEGAQQRSQQEMQRDNLQGVQQDEAEGLLFRVKEAMPLPGQQFKEQGIVHQEATQGVQQDMAHTIQHDVAQDVAQAHDIQQVFQDRKVGHTARRRVTPDSAVEDEEDYIALSVQNIQQGVTQSVPQAMLRNEQQHTVQDGPQFMSQSVQNVIAQDEQQDSLQHSMNVGEEFQPLFTSPCPDPKASPNLQRRFFKTQRNNSQWPPN